MDVLYLFQVVSTEQQTWVSWALSVRKATPWFSSILQKFGNCMLYCLSFTLKAPLWIFLSVWVSFWGQIHIHENQTPSSFQWCLGWSLPLVTLRLHSSSYVTLGSRRRLTSSAWIKRVTAWRYYIWQQDSALNHTSRITQSWLSENFCNFITPNIYQPKFPVYNPFDYCVGNRWIRDQKNSMQHQRWTGGNDNGNIYHFK